MKSLRLHGLVALLVCRDCAAWISPTFGCSKAPKTTPRMQRKPIPSAHPPGVATQHQGRAAFAPDPLSGQAKTSKSPVTRRKDDNGSESRRSLGLAAAVPLFLATPILSSLSSPLAAFALTPPPPSFIPQESLVMMKQQRKEFHPTQLPVASISRLDRSAQSWLVATAKQTQPAHTAAASPTVQSLSSTSIVTAAEVAVEQRQDDYSMLDEVWTLIDKYYIDRSFYNQDWKAVKQQFQTKLAAQTQNPSSDNNNNKEAAVVAEMVQSLHDKYSRVLDASAYSAIQKYDLIGVGVTLMPDPTTQLIVVGAPPIPKSASAMAGLQQGDWVTAINGISTKNRNAFDIINQIAENPNAPTVDMTIVPRNHIIATTAVAATNAATGNTNAADNSNQFQRTVTLPRAFAQVKNPVVYKISETRADGTKVGYVRISEFNALIKSKLQDALHDLVDNQGANALVLDIRHNGGGAFQSAVEISSLFLPPDTVATYVVDQSAALIPFKTTLSKTDKVQVPNNIPVAIWLDNQSASASEVFAGSLHDNCRAVLMGDRSFGKGLIQAVYGLKNGAGLVLTVARYVTPDGIDIQGTGIQPDIVGHVAPPIPGLLSDTSAVDFREVRQRLDPSMCHVPGVPTKL